MSRSISSKKQMWQEKLSRFSDVVHGYRYEPNWSPVDWVKRVALFVVLPDAYFWFSHHYGHLSIDDLGYGVFADYMMFLLTWWFQYSDDYRKKFDDINES